MSISWKIQLVAEITFSSVGEEDSKKSYPIYMHSMVADDLLKSFLDDHQFSLRTKMKKK